MPITLPPEFVSLAARHDSDRARRAVPRAQAGVPAVVYGSHRHVSPSTAGADVLRESTPNAYSFDGLTRYDSTNRHSGASSRGSVSPPSRGASPAGGLVDRSTVRATRSLGSLKLNPISTPTKSPADKIIGGGGARFSRRASSHGTNPLPGFSMFSSRSYANNRAKWGNDVWWRDNSKTHQQIAGGSSRRGRPGSTSFRRSSRSTVYTAPELLSESEQVEEQPRAVLRSHRAQSRETNGALRLQRQAEATATVLAPVVRHKPQRRRSPQKRDSAVGRASTERNRSTESGVDTPKAAAQALSPLRTSNQGQLLARRSSGKSPPKQAQAGAKTAGAGTSAAERAQRAMVRDLDAEGLSNMRHDFVVALSQQQERLLSIVAGEQALSRIHEAASDFEVTASNGGAAQGSAAALSAALTQWTEGDDMPWDDDPAFAEAASNMSFEDTQRYVKQLLHKCERNNLSALSLLRSSAANLGRTTSSLHSTLMQATRTTDEMQSIAEGAEGAASQLQDSGVATKLKRALNVTKMRRQSIAVQNTHNHAQMAAAAVAMMEAPELKSRVSELEIATKAREDALSIANTAARAAERQLDDERKKLALAQQNIAKLRDEAEAEAKKLTDALRDRDAHRGTQRLVTMRLAVVQAENTRLKEEQPDEDAPADGEPP